MLRLGFASRSARVAKTCLRPSFLSTTLQSKRPFSQIPVELFQVDSFTNEVFSGNPASVAIVPPQASITRKWQAKLANEMNINETVFIQQTPSDPTTFTIRWFEPDATEILLGGHAALASAHVLWAQGLVNVEDKIKLKSANTTLYAELKSHIFGDGEINVIELEFPSNPIKQVSNKKSKNVESLLDAMGLYEEDTLYIGKNSWDYLVELDSVEDIERLNPNIELMKRINIRGIMATARGDTDSPYHFVSRYFAPKVGIPEDPATGSSHCGLAPYWTRKLFPDATCLSPNGGPWLTAMQCSSRGGLIRCQEIGSKVKIAGQAVTVFSAQLTDAALPTQLTITSDS